MELPRAKIALRLSRGCSGQGGLVTPRPTEERMATKDTGGQKHTTRRAEEVEETDPQGTEEVKERQDKLSEDVDAILDEIDDVLEENAEEFVRSYVQKGGQ
jgi:ubiquitin-like protein Pup